VQAGTQQVKMRSFSGRMRSPAPRILRDFCGEGELSSIESHTGELNMKSKSKLSPLLGAAVLFITTSCNASARPPQARVERAVIESIDRDAYVLLLRLRDDAKPLTLVWNSRTRFVEEARFVTAAELRTGAPVAVSYRTPFFGKPFASKIDFECGAASRAMP